MRGCLLWRMRRSWRLRFCQVLQEAGFDILGPARNVDQALELLRTRHCDVAVLDINLGKETSEPVAKELMRLCTPFVTMTGYSRQHFPAIFLSAPALTKPI